MATGDIVILHALDGADWEYNIATWIKKHFTSNYLSILHERIESLFFPPRPSQIHHLIKSKVIIFLITPRFLEFVECHPDMSVFCRYLSSSTTIAILCGVRERDVSDRHKRALESYDTWSRFIIRDSSQNDIPGFLSEILEQINNIMVLQKRDNLQSLVDMIPPKVMQKCSKVCVILSTPLHWDDNIQIILEADGEYIQLPVKVINPYTVQYVVPDNCLHIAKIVNIHIKCNDQFLATKQLRIESEMSELQNLIKKATSPVHFMCKTLGLVCLHDLDMYLAENVRKNLPAAGCSFFGRLCSTQSTRRNNSEEEEMPTLLHFAAYYGLKELTLVLLMCPGARVACSIQNTNGLTPAHLAYNEHHKEISELLECFQKIAEFDSSLPNRKLSISPFIQNNILYDIPNVSPVSVDHENESVTTVDEQEDDCDSDYTVMHSSVPCDLDRSNLLPHQKVIKGLDSPRISVTSLVGSFSEKKEQNTSNPPDAYDSQLELIKILDGFKNGQLSFSELEQLWEAWHEQNKTTLQTTRNASLEELKEKYKNAQKQKTKKHGFFAEFKSFICAKSKIRESSFVKSTATGSTDEKVDAPAIPEEQKRRASVLSTTSFSSSSSRSSICSSVTGTADSGNHSDFGDDDKRIKKEDEKLQFSSNKNLDSKPTPINISERPPAPPPRPTIDIISQSVSSTLESGEISPIYIEPESFNFRSPTTKKSASSSVLFQNSPPQLALVAEELKQKISGRLSPKEKFSTSLKSPDSKTSDKFNIPDQSSHHQNYNTPLLPPQIRSRCSSSPLLTGQYPSEEEKQDRSMYISLQRRSSDYSSYTDFTFHTNYQDRENSIPSEPPPPPPL